MCVQIRNSSSLVRNAATRAECKCRDFLPSFLSRRPFGVQKRLSTNRRTKLARRPFSVFLTSFLEDKKAAEPFCRPFLSFGWQKDTKRTAKSHTSFFALQFGQQPKKDSKKLPRSFWTAKSCPGEKDGKKSWHLHSPLIKFSKKILVPAIF